MLLAVLLASCNKQAPQAPAPVYERKYPYGTVMYAKPDSLKVVIKDYDSQDDTYQAYWREGADYSDAWYSEEGFYGQADITNTILNE